MVYRASMAQMTELYALLRVMRRNFASCAATVLMLAVAIAAATSMFALADAALWRDLPYREPWNLAVLFTRHANGEANVSIPDFLAVRDRVAGIHVAAAGASTPEYALTGFGEPRQIRGRVLSADYFSTLGVPIAGRDFRRTEEGPGNGYVAILTERLARQLSKDNSALGITLALNGRAYTVIGVLPTYRDPFGDVDIYVPYPFAPNLPRRLRLFTPVVRLGEANIASLRSALSVLTHNTDDPEAAGYTLDAAPLADHVSATSRSSVLMLFAAATGLVAIAIVNLAMLIGARAQQRKSEFAIRFALGASRATISWLASLEWAILIFCGAIIAVALTRLSIPLLQERFGASILNAVAVGPRTLLFTLIVTALAILAAPIASTTALREGPTAGRRIVSSRLRTGRALVVSQIAISVLLVTISVTLALSFLNLRQVDPGFRTSGLLASRISLPGAIYTDRAKRSQFWRTLIRDLNEKQMTQAAITTELPLSGEDNPTTFTTRLSDGAAVPTKLRSVSPNYFDVMRIRLLEGRNLSEHDVSGEAQIAVVVNQKLATILSRIGSPVGQIVSLDPGDTPIVARVVGVVADIRHERLSAEPKPEAYVSFEQTPLQTYSLVLDSRRSSIDASRLVRATMDTIDSAQPFTQIVPMSEYITRNLAVPRFQTGLLSLFALVALSVAATGLYGLLTYLVASTRREWAVRLAVGASPAYLRNIVLKQSLTDSIRGLGIGFAIFLFATRWFQGVFYNVTVWNPWLLAITSLVVSTTCVLSATMPAIRVARISPSEALSN
jgi:predicted permease